MDRVVKVYKSDGRELEESEDLNVLLDMTRMVQKGHVLSEGKQLATRNQVYIV